MNLAILHHVETCLLTMFYKESVTTTETNWLIIYAAGGSYLRLQNIGLPSIENCKKLLATT